MSKLDGEATAAETVETEEVEEVIDGEAEAAEVEITQDQADELVEKGFTEEEIAVMDEDTVKVALAAQKGEAEPTITQEMVEQYGLTKSFVGKPLTELAKAYSEAQKHLNRKETEFKKQLKELETKKTEPTSEVDFDDFMNLDAKEQKKILNSIEANAEAKASAKFNELLAPIMPIIYKYQEDMFFNDLQKDLGKDADARKVFNDWKSDGKFSEEELTFLSQSENLLRQNIKQYAETKKLSKTLESDSKKNIAEIKKEIAKRLKNTVKNGKVEDGEYRIKKTADGVADWNAGDDDLNASLTRIVKKNAEKLGHKV